jgi:hypothetical protein
MKGNHSMQQNEKNQKEWIYKYFEKRMLNGIRHNSSPIGDLHSHSGCCYYRQANKEKEMLKYVTTNC